MTVSARQYATGAENIASAHAIRQRLMAPKNAFRPTKPQLLTVVVNVAAERPLWQRKAIKFDEHVRSWQWNIASAKGNKAREYLIMRCAQLCVDLHQVVAGGRERSISGPRQLIMYELKTKFDYSYPRIAKEFGVDHTTVVHAVQKIAKQRGEQTPECLSAEERLMTDRALNAKVRKDYREWSSIEDLSFRFSLSTRAIAAVIKTENWTRDSRTDIPHRFRPVQISIGMLRSEYEEGLSYKKLTARHQISDRTIRRMAVAYGWERFKA